MDGGAASIRADAVGADETDVRDAVIGAAARRLVGRAISARRTMDLREAEIVRVRADRARAGSVPRPPRLSGVTGGDDRDERGRGEEDFRNLNI